MRQRITHISREIHGRQDLIYGLVPTGHIFPSFPPVFSLCTGHSQFCRWSCSQAGGNRHQSLQQTLAFPTWESLLARQRVQAVVSDWSGRSRGHRRMSGARENVLGFWRKIKSGTNVRKDFRQKEQMWINVKSCEEVVPRYFKLQFQPWPREWPGGSRD